MEVREESESWREWDGVYLGEDNCKAGTRGVAPGGETFCEARESIVDVLLALRGALGGEECGELGGERVRGGEAHGLVVGAQRLVEMERHLVMSLICV